MQVPRLSVLIAGIAVAASCFAATFGTVVPVRGTVSDIALDERRSRLYIGNFAAGRIEVMNTTDRSFGTALTVSMPPSTLALSPDQRYLIVGQANNVADAPTKGGFTVFDLDAGQRQDVAIADPVLAVSFGNGSQALMVTTKSLLLVDPITARTQ